MLPPPTAGPPSAEGPGSEGVLAAGPLGTCEQKHRDVMTQASPHSGERPPAREAETTLCPPGGPSPSAPSRGGRRQVDLSQNGLRSLSLSLLLLLPGLSPPGGPGPRPPFPCLVGGSGLVESVVGAVPRGCFNVWRLLGAHPRPCTLTYHQASSPRPLRQGP